MSDRDRRPVPQPRPPTLDHALITDAGHDDVAAHLPVVEGSTGLSNAYVQLFDFARHH